MIKFTKRLQLFCLTAVLLKILLSSIAHAQSSPRCNYAGVKSLLMPLFPEKIDSMKFLFNYQIVGQLDPNELVVLYLPGGPGGTSIADYKSEDNLSLMKRRGLPENVPWIFFDPRTSGCNRGYRDLFPDESLTSWYLAGDIIQVIKHLKLKKYIIYGHSYGSQWATFVAGRASLGEAQAPYAVVMSGVLGVGKEDGSYSVPSSVTHEWALLKEQLSPKILAKLRENKPLGYNPRTWMKYLTSGMKKGYRVIDGVFRYRLLDELRLLEIDDKKAWDPLYDSLDLYGAPDDREEFSSRLYNKIDCHEFSPADGGVIFRNGELIPDPDNTVCDGEAFDRLYDSAQFQITAPIYYLAGTNDTAAPYEGARYHFDNQLKTTRNFVTVPGGSHNHWGFVFPDCKSLIWDKIFKLENLTDALTRCVAPVKLEIKEKIN